MDIRQIQYFLAIVDTGSFSAAADELYISQSSLSKIIIALEKELNVCLFDRSKRKVILTEAGQAFLEPARKLNADYKALLVEMDRYKSETDTFSIAAIPVLTQYGITTSIAKFRIEHPGIHFVMEEIHGSNILPGLDEHRFDLAIARNNYIDPEKYTKSVISQDKLLAVVSKKNHHATSQSISIKELSKDNFIVFDKVTDLHRLIMDVCNDAGFDPTIFYSSQKKVSVFALIGTNIGLALMPSKIFEYHKDSDVVAIPLDEEIECNIVLIQLKNKKLPISAETFIQYLTKANPDNE